MGDKTSRLTRSIKIENRENEIALSAIRYRDSDGNAYIELHVAEKIIRFQNDERLGDKYEHVAREAAALLERISLELCSLPPTEPELDEDGKPF